MLGVTRHSTDDPRKRENKESHLKDAGGEEFFRSPSLFKGVSLALALAQTRTQHGVSWLEVVGKVDGGQLVADEKYEVKFMVKMRADAFGWSGSPVFLMAKDASGKFVWKKADLSLLPSDTEHPIPDIQSHTAPRDQVVYGLFEIWRGKWKGGVEIVRVIIDKVPPDTFKP
ncbi:hypothetical protein GW17_00058639 [Ensete ventricosum]|nr:hypothetical protein GW17_00058639 [Ensete ventricosum]